VHRLEPTLGAAVLARVVGTVASSPRSLVQLERRLGDGACLASGQAGGRRLLELAGALVEAGAASVRIPACAACGQQRWLRYASPAGMVCAGCQPPPAGKRCPADPHGQAGATGTCPACRRARADHRIYQAVTATLGPVDPELVLGLAGRAASRVREREQLADWLASHPDALVVGASSGPLALPRVLWELREAGIAGVARARCVQCGVARRQLSLLVAGGRICNRCLRRNLQAPCSRCGKTATVAFRDRQRRAVCHTCRRRDPATFQPCRRCGTVGPVASRAGDGRPLGVCCYTNPARRCGGCGTVAPITATTSDGPRCAACYQRPARPCGVCGEPGLIVRKARDGRPDVCQRCYRLPVARCLVCGRLRPCVLVAAGTPYCGTHTPRPAKPCAGCGSVGPVAGYLPDGPRCQRCWERARSRRGVCTTCGAQRRLFGPDPGSCGDCVGFTWNLRCASCGIEDRLYQTGRCARCVLGQRLDALLGEPVGILADHMRAVRELLGAVDRPRSMLGWLQRSPGAVLLADLADGTLALSHEALDTLAPARWVTHVRAILVTAGALPPREELLAGFARWVDGLLASIPIAEDRWLVASFARTHLQPFLDRRQHQPRRGLVGPVTVAHAAVRAGVAWLGWLRAHRSHTLATCTQDDLDTWLAGATTAAAARRFIRWAQRGGLCPPLEFPKRGALSPVAAADADRRAATVHALLNQPGIPVADQVAGLLVTVYGQHLSRLVALRAGDLVRQGDVVFLSRGGYALELPDPLGSWAWTLRTAPAPSSVQPAGDPATRWLFPGRLPGRALRPASLGARLRRYGITARAARNDALTDIAAAAAPLTVASLLDLHPNTANAWAEASSGSWSRYLDDLLDDHDDEPSNPGEDPDD
jgi:hypothetical protein